MFEATSFRANPRRSDSDPPLLEVENVSKSFGGVQALRSGSFRLDRREVLAVVGANGAGKSTLIKTVVGVYAPDSGEIRIKGEPVDLHDHSVSRMRERGVEVVYQDLALVPNGLVISLLKIPSFVTTLAMLIIVRAVVIIISDGTSIYMTDGSVSGGTNISSVTAPWLLSMGKFPAIFIVAAVVAVFMWIFYEKTHFGQQLKAVGGNEKVLRLVGINVTTFKIKVFAAAGVMVGIASCVNLARAGAATPQAGLMIELDAIAAVALGGTPLTGGYGSVVKTIIGALTLTVVRNGLTIAGVPPSWSQVALGALLIAAIAISLNRSKVDVVK